MARTLQLPEEGANKLSRREMKTRLLRLKVDTRTIKSSEMTRLCKHEQRLLKGFELNLCLSVEIDNYYKFCSCLITFDLIKPGGLHFK